MAAFNNRNQIVFIPNVKIKDLANDVEYPVDTLKFVNTQYGRKVVAEIQAGGEAVSTFLPRRFSDDFNKEPRAFEEFAELASKKKLAFTLSGKGIYKNVDFIIKE